jgi:hypothetical protein
MTRIVRALVLVLALTPSLAFAGTNDNVCPLPDVKAGPLGRLVRPASNPDSGCHLLAFPLFIPSFLSLSYAGIRIGGAYQASSYQPSLLLAGKYQAAVSSAALEVSKLVLERSFSVLATAKGTIATGVDTSTLLSSGSTLGGGFDFGFLWGNWLNRASRMGVLFRTGEQYGTSLLVERAVTAINQNPMKETGTMIAGLLGPAAGAIPIPYVSEHIDLDLGWIFVPFSWLSLQTVIGGGHEHRYFRTSDTTAGGVLGAFDIDTWTPFRIGTAIEFDLGAISKNVTGGVPIAFLIELQTARTHTSLRTVAEALAGRTDLSSTTGTQLVALGIHFSSAEDANLDAAITGFYQVNLPPDLASGVGFGTQLPYALGGDLLARYVF